MKKLLTAILIMIALVSAVCADAEKDELLRGYDKKQGGYQYVQYGSYPYEQDGSVQPVLWRVLKVEENSAMLLTESIIDVHYVHWDSKGYYEFSNWQGSDVYNYLQNDMAQLLFTASEKEALLTDQEDGSVLALMHVNDVREAAYGFADNNSRRCKGTPYAKEKGLYMYKDKCSPWILREKSQDAKMQQREVLNEGKLGRVGCTNIDVGIRPCVNVSLDKVVIGGGSGTIEDPYQLCAAAVENMEAAQEGTAQIPAESNAEGETGLEEEQSGIETAISKEQEKVLDTEANTEYAAQSASDMEETVQVQTGENVFSAAADPDGIHPLFPMLNKEGFLPEGEPEFVLEDEENGVWLYCSQTLRVEIIRKNGENHEKKPLRWYEAQIYTRDSSEVFDLYPYNEEKYTNVYQLALAEEMAKQHKLVFSINSDYFIYRVERDKEEKKINRNNIYPIGTEIRNGQIMYTQTRSSKATVYPPLDVLALYPDGDMRVFENGLLYENNYKNASIMFEGEKYEFKSSKDNKLNGRQQAEQAIAEMILESGATDTLCFGPILVDHGEKVDTGDWAKTCNPRTAIGMVEKGHYVCVVVEGRLLTKKISGGENCIWLVNKMAELGCTVAMNLDGGATTAMMFMGKQISVSGDYGNGLNNRKQNELLGIGVSELVK